MFIIILYTRYNRHKKNGTKSVLKEVRQDNMKV